MPGISVIVPVYNVEKYLRRCVDSILAQTFTDFELILVDDGSPDNCGKICDEYANKDGRVHVIHKKNSGVSNSRNVALDVATGQYVCFCDSDDYVKNDYLETLLNTLVATNSDCVSCNCTLVNDMEENRVLNWNVAEYQLDDTTKKQQFIKDVVLKNKIIWAMWCRIFKKSIIDDYNIRVCESCENFAEDLGFFLMYYVHCEKAVHIDYAGYYYYQRSDSMMATTVDDVKLNALNEVSYAFYNHLSEYKTLSLIVRNYSSIHFWIMNNQYQRVVGVTDYRRISGECRKIVRKKWYNKMIRKFVFGYKEPIILYGKDMTFTYKNFCLYTIHMRYKLFCILDVFCYKFLHRRKDK